MLVPVDGLLPIFRSLAVFYNPQHLPASQFPAGIFIVTPLQSYCAQCAQCAQLAKAFVLQWIPWAHRT